MESQSRLPFDSATARLPEGCILPSACRRKTRSFTTSPKLRAQWCDELHCPISIEFLAPTVDPTEAKQLVENHVTRHITISGMAFVGDQPNALVAVVVLSKPRAQPVRRRRLDTLLGRHMKLRLVAGRGRAPQGPALVSTSRV